MRASAWLRRYLAPLLQRYDAPGACKHFYRYMPDGSLVCKNCGDKI